MRVPNALKLIAFKGAPFYRRFIFHYEVKKLLLLLFDTPLIGRQFIWERIHFQPKYFLNLSKQQQQQLNGKERKKDTRMWKEKVQWFNGIRNHHESTMIVYSNDFSEGIELIEKQSHRDLCANNSISVDLQIDAAWEWLSWVWLSWVKGDFWRSIYSCSKYGKRRMQTTFP